MRRPLALAATLLAGASPVESPSPIRLDQLGFETNGPKIAIVPTVATAPLRWTLRDAHGWTVASGSTQPFGEDKASGERIHRIDLSGFRTAGQGYALQVGRAVSRPFAISPRSFVRLATEAMSFFYQQRGGVLILAAYVQHPDLAPTGHKLAQPLPLVVPKYLAFHANHQKPALNQNIEAMRILKSSPEPRTSRRVIRVLPQAYMLAGAMIQGIIKSFYLLWALQLRRSGAQFCDVLGQISEQPIGGSPQRSAGPTDRVELTRTDRLYTATLG